MAFNENMTVAEYLEEVFEKRHYNPNLGDVTITNDGATILNDLDIEHPGAKDDYYPVEVDRDILYMKIQKKILIRT